MKLYSEKEIYKKLEKMMPTLVITEQESGDLAVHNKGVSNALIVAFLTDDGYRLLIDLDKFRRLWSNDKHRVYIGKYNQYECIDVYKDFPYGIEIKEMNNGWIHRYRILTSEELNQFNQELLAMD